MQRVELSASQIQTLVNIPQMRELEIDIVAESLKIMLRQKASELQWKHLPGHVSTDDEIASMLPSMPCLSEGSNKIRKQTDAG